MTRTEATTVAISLLLVDVGSSLNLGLPLAPAGLALPGDIPDDSSLSSLSLFFQVLELDAGAFKRLSFTPGLECHFGE